MVYDAATGNVVLFGGVRPRGTGFADLNDTWTWDGTTWAKQAPATSPPNRTMHWVAYDAATSKIRSCSAAMCTPHLDLGRLHLDPAAPGDQPASPGAAASMAYDAATDNLRSCSAAGTT